jgi:hypothetical protein
MEQFSMHEKQFKIIGEKQASKSNYVVMFEIILVIEFLEGVLQVVV